MPSLQVEVVGEHLRVELVDPQSVMDSAVIGDYDTINKTLERAISQSNFSKAQFIDTNGGVLTARHAVTPPVVPPVWLLDMVQGRLFDINHNIQVGGKDYGVLRLSFAAEEIAGELWRIAIFTFLASLGALLGGVVLIRIPLKRWLGNFDRVRAREPEILSGAIDVNALLDSDAPEEIRGEFELAQFRIVDLWGIPVGVVTQLVLVPLLYWPLEAIWPDAFAQDKVQERAKDMWSSTSGASATRRATRWRSS